MAVLASKLPLVGFLAGPLAAVLAATIVLISANTGIMGASRLAFSMAELGLIGERLAHVHPRFQTPTRAILLFSGVAMIEALFAFLSGRKAMETMANMYAFGAMLAYFLSCLALLALRLREPHVPRPYQVPLNIRVKGMAIPLPGILGVLGTGGMVALVLWTHDIARIVGPLWVLVWIGYYAIFRRRRRQPVFRSLPRDWETMHMRLLEEAEEWDLLEWFKAEQGRRAKRRPESKVKA